MKNYIRAFLVLFFFGLLTACGGGGGGGNSVATMPTMTVTMPDNPGTPAPVMLAFDSPEIGAVRHLGLDNTQHFIVLSVAAEGTTMTFNGQNFALTRLSVSFVEDFTFRLPRINRASLHAHGDIVTLITDGEVASLTAFIPEVAFETRPSITMYSQLCDARWLAEYLNSILFTDPCPPVPGMSYSPNMPNVLHAAMADTFHRGIGIGESRFAFSGRHNGNDRAAGFTYDMGGYALRTDYIRLPSKQDSAVWLDTYRFGVMPYINDEVRFFAGVDSYRNAILAIDTNGENLHRFGVAVGDGYAVKYEFRVRL
ncbi:MAG: hypothetical protein ACR2P4_09785 [Gammaproteobacteria bacterium]